MNKLFELSSRFSYSRAIRLFVNLVEDALAEITYDADLAGLSYSVANDEDGIVLSVEGYNDKLDVLLRTVLDKLRNLAVAPDRLKVIAEKVGQFADRRCRRTTTNAQCRSSATTETTTWASLPTSRRHSASGC